MVVPRLQLEEYFPSGVMLNVRKNFAKQIMIGFGFLLDWTRKKHFCSDRLGHIAHKSKAKTKQEVKVPYTYID